MTAENGRSGRSLRRRYDAVVDEEFAARRHSEPAQPLGEHDLAALPAPVRRYVARSGALGLPSPQNMRVVMDAAMYRKPGQSPMRARSVQYSFFDRPTRLFLMDARMFGLPVAALHIYRHETATFTVRVASTFTTVNQSGTEISSAESVTVLNDLCLMAPGAMVNPRLSWTPVDDRAASVSFTNGPHQVAATLEFNDQDELINFWSDDRPDSSSGSFIPSRWSTPVTQYADDDGRHLLRRGAAVYDRPEGAFTYGDFAVRSIDFDVAGAVRDEAGSKGS